MPSRFPSGHLPFESKLEMDFLTLLQLDIRMFDVATQPMKLELTVEGQRRTYTPDVLATWHGAMPHPYPQRQVVFEVKPLNVLREKRALLSPKYRAARSHLARLGIGFRVVTERTIRTPRLGNAQLIAPEMLQRQDRNLITQIARFAKDRGPVRLGDLREHLDAEGAIRGSILGAAYNMIGSRQLRCDLDFPINDNTLVTWWGDVELGKIFARA